MTADSATTSLGTTTLRPELRARLADATGRLRALGLAEGPDAFRPEASAAIVAARLHTMTLPEEQGGLAAGLSNAVQVLAEVAAVDGSTGLGFAMHTHLLGGTVECRAWPNEPVRQLVQSVVAEGALVNAASTEAGSGSPARGGLPATTATLDGDVYRVTGEKTWTTWLPVLRWALVSARLAPADPVSVGNLLVDLSSPGIERLPGFEALGMRGSASGRLAMHDVRVPKDCLVVLRRPGEPDPRGASPAGWFGLCVAAVYLGIGEGARDHVVRWAMDRRPGDGSSAVADIPSVQVRLGRLDAALRAARIVLLDVARRWDASDAAGRGALMGDVGLAKVGATNAAVLATDEALRIAGGPGFLAGPIERAFRDARAGLINPPLDDIAFQDFAKRLIDDARREPDRPARA
ncbi:MAG TPA: acyl-CoA dehydrogenase family protein [Candidatus Saccharimonadales bacterium]|nr:acyl-CoA dehydrogenase family protein [Candidatus Saccharimonadales bacterium]